MAYEVVIHDSAKRAYLEIVEYLALVSDGAQAPSRFIEEFDKQIALLADNPELYRLSRVPELAQAGYRVALVNGYVALYYVSGGTVHIAYLFHQSQDYARYVLL